MSLLDCDLVVKLDKIVWSHYFTLLHILLYSMLNGALLQNIELKSSEKLDTFPIFQLRRQLKHKSDEELSENEEEILVYVEFEGLVGSNVFNNKELQLDMIGIDTEHPTMQINGRFYEGTYEDAIGTYMFFEKDDNPQVDDIVFDKVPNLKYFAKTRKVLKMQRVFTKPRVEVLGDSEHDGCTPNIDTLSQAGVPPKYQDKALQFWSKVHDDRLEELSTYLEKQKIREEKKSKGIESDSESDENSSFITHKAKEKSKET